jgi:uncharacterized membrane protein YphA (DoxX/SURF4 family)
MGSSKVKYALFLALFIAMLGSEFVLNNDSAYGNIASQQSKVIKEGLMTGNVVSEAPGAGNIFLPVLIAIFVICTIYLWSQRKKLWLVEHDAGQYVGLILRVLLGVILLIFGFNFMPSPLGYVFAMVKLVLGVLLILGLFTRFAGYVAFFYFLSFLINPVDEVMMVLLLGIALCVMLLGAGRFSIDHDRKKRR